MKTRSRQSGLSLTEMTVVVAAVALLVSLGLPAVRSFFRSFETEAGTKSMISAALTSARAIAAKERRYAGIRFQKEFDGGQYIVFIIHDFDKTGLAPGFRAIDGLQPIKLPDSVGVMDLIVRLNHGATPAAAQDTTDEPIQAAYLDDTNPSNLGPDGRNKYITDTCAFSILFAPSGKLVIHAVRLRNRDGVYQPDNGPTAPPNKFSADDIFNSPTNIVSYNIGMFVQDDYAELGFGAESSRSRFIIYDRTRLDQLDVPGKFNYLASLEVLFVNPYTGTMIQR